MEIYRKTILVVEDEESLIEAITTKLEMDNFNVISARTVEQALKSLTENHIDAIWLDHYLLGKDDGLALVVKLKEEGSLWRNIPVFVVTNSAGVDKVNAYMRIGVKKYFIKSNNRLDQIISDIKGYLENGESTKK